jgi:hypothetical protein
MTTSLPQGQFRAVLNWTGPKEGAVRDVDAYLLIPGREMNPIAYKNRDDGNGANLDYDVTAWRGPETITITERRPGTFTYYVNNYNLRCDRTALSMSDVTVRVYEDDRAVGTYAIPPGVGINYVFFKIVDGTLIDVRQFDDSLPVYGEMGSCYPEPFALPKSDLLFGFMRAFGLTGRK